MIGVHQNLSGHLAGGQPGEIMDASITEPNSITANLPVKPHRRRYSLTFKQRVVAEMLVGQESVSVIARRHDINANLLFKLRKTFGANRRMAERPCDRLVLGRCWTSWKPDCMNNSPWFRRSRAWRRRLAIRCSLPRPIPGLLRMI